MKRISAFFRREPVLCIAALAALATCFAVPPSAAYAGYIDWRTLALLYALMISVSSLRRCGALERTARRLYASAADTRSLALVLTLLPFFSSMLLTNDVSLLTFVPFAAAVLTLSRERALLTEVVILQTVAANLGSTLTPVGNPQNLYLYSYYQMTPAAFFSATVPLTALSLLLLLLLIRLLPKRPIPAAAFQQTVPLEKKGLAVSLALLALSLLTVFRVLPWPALLLLLMGILAVFDRTLWREADFFLLLTFVCFFIFVGNLGSLPAVERTLERALEGRELLLSALSSQIISNVPAAVLLSAFTDNARALLLGVDIGGLGTPVASLASLISLRLYAKEPDARTGRFLLWFFIVNFTLLAVLLIFAQAALLR